MEGDGERGNDTYDTKGLAFQKARVDGRGSDRRSDGQSLGQLRA